MVTNMEVYIHIYVINACVTLGVHFPSLNFALLYFIPLFLALSSFFKLLISSASLALACFQHVQPRMSSRYVAHFRDRF